MAKRRDASTQLPLENVALGLVMAGPKHGYELYEDFVETFSLIWKAGRSKFYAMLSESERKGYLQSTVVPQGGRPPRKVYHLTDSGREFFMHWLYQPVTPIHQCRVELLAKLRFFTLLSLPDVRRLVDAQLDVSYAALDVLKENAAGQPGADDDPLSRLVYSFREKRIAALIEWLLECEEHIHGD